MGKSFPAAFTASWPGRMTRRKPFLLGASLLFLLLCCIAYRLAYPTERAVPLGRSSSVSVYGWWDLPAADPRSHELSGIAWDPTRKILYAIPDKTSQLVELVPDATFHQWQFGRQIPVHIPGSWDGEGVAVTEHGFYLSSEAGPNVYEVGTTGAWLTTLPLPEHFHRSRVNLAFESLTLTEDGRYLFTANEQALFGDGATTSRQAGTVVRILRHDRTTGSQVEFAYRTDPLFLGGLGGELGVVDLAALSSQELLVMERGYVWGVGNSVRIYRVSVAGAQDTLTKEYLDRDVAVLNKTLFVDLSTLPDGAFPLPARPQRSRMLANYEGLAIGPRLAGNHRLLFLISDDNSSKNQTARLLVLMVPDL